MLDYEYSPAAYATYGGGSVATSVIILVGM